MVRSETTFSNAQGYGLFCGKKCVAKKQAQGIPPKRGKKNIALWEARQAKAQAEAQAISQSQGSKSKAPIIIVSVLGVGLIIGVILITRKRNK